MAGPFEDEYHNALIWVFLAVLVAVITYFEWPSAGDCHSESSNDAAATTSKDSGVPFGKMIAFGFLMCHAVVGLGRECYTAFDAYSAQSIHKGYYNDYSDIKDRKYV